ncbi:hypothetical protein CHARACLAT_023848 [Characodon lateralis]|uniref:Uncharacterized protein n=1 Tax=Characodon lateralis TaxID=208331 RepID=A0ABU7ELQ9_9TELE|nr:hypothetical protein [Characodon lateralis]
MGTAVSKRKNLRNDAISSVATKVRRRKYFFIMQKVPPTPDRGRVYISTGYIHPALCSIQCCCELELQSTCGCVFMYDRRDSLDPVYKIKHAWTRLGSL